MDHVAGIHVHPMPPHRRPHRFCIGRRRRGQQRPVRRPSYPDRVPLGMPCRRHRNCAASVPWAAATITICRIRVHSGPAAISRRRRISHRACSSRRRAIHMEQRQRRVRIDRRRCSSRCIIRTRMAASRPARFSCRRLRRPSFAIRPARISHTAAGRRRCRISSPIIRSRRRRHNIYASRADQHNCHHNRDNTDRIRSILLGCHWSRRSPSHM